MVLKWIEASVARHGGDPARLILSGNSAGAMHVADYVFREDYQIENDGLAGAIIITPPTVDLNDPERDTLYYGDDGDWSDQSIINALEGRKTPVLIAHRLRRKRTLCDCRPDPSSDRGTDSARRPVASYRFGAGTQSHLNRCAYRLKQ